MNRSKCDLVFEVKLSWLTNLNILFMILFSLHSNREAAQIVNKNGTGPGTGPGTGLGTATFNPNQTNGYSSRNMNSNNVCPPQQQALVGPIGPIGSSSRPFNRNFLPQQYQNNFQQPLTQLPHHLQQQLAFQPMAPDLRRIDSDNVVRLPRGPDGSTGFILKR